MNLHQARAAAGLSVLTFISADGDLNTAAIAEGLAVENPNIHQLSIQSHMPDPPPLHVFSVIGGGIMDVPSNAPDPPEKGEHSVFARHALRGGVTFGERSRRNLAECFRLRVVL